jgi:hypothetical protein
MITVKSKSKTPGLSKPHPWQFPSMPPSRYQRRFSVAISNSFTDITHNKISVDTIDPLPLFLPPTITAIPNTILLTLFTRLYFLSDLAFAGRAQVLAMGAFAFAYLRMRLEQRGQELLATAFTRPLCHVVFVIIFTAFGLGFAAFAFAAVAWCSNTGPVCKYTTFAPTFAFGYMVGENIVS